MYFATLYFILSWKYFRSGVWVRRRLGPQLVAGEKPGDQALHEPPGPEDELNVGLDVAQQKREASAGHHISLNQVHHPHVHTHRCPVTGDKRRRTRRCSTVDEA